MNGRDAIGGTSRRSGSGTHVGAGSPIIVVVAAVVVVVPATVHAWGAIGVVVLAHAPVVVVVI